MARSLKVTIRYQDDVYHAAVPGDERADGLDPEEKGNWRLKPQGVDRPAHGLYLDHAIGEQVGDGGELVLEEKEAGNRRLSTGNY